MQKVAKKKEILYTTSEKKCRIYLFLTMDVLRQIPKNMHFLGLPIPPNVFTHYRYTSNK